MSTAGPGGRIGSALGIPLRASRLAMDGVRAEPAGLVVAAGFYLVVALALSGVWRSAAEASGGSIVGYSTTALVWYIATSEAAVMSLPFRLIDDIGVDIGSGRFASEMLRPASALAVRVGGELGRLVPRLAAIGATGVALGLLTGGRPPDAAALALALPALLLALATNLLAQHAFAAIAFWVLDARSTWFLYQKLVFVLGGMLLPLEVLPDPVAAVARLLPFSAMAYVPARLASGHFEPELLLVQAFWLVAIGFVAHLVFRAGERHLVVEGS